MMSMLAQRRSRLTKSLKSAIQAGQLSKAQLVRLITHEARELGMTYRQAVIKARAGNLPDTTIGPTWPSSSRSSTRLPAEAATLPIVGKTPGEAVDRFLKHVNGVLSKTIIQALDVPAKGLTQVSFPRRNGSPTAARLDTRFGRMRFLFWQTLGTEPLDGGFKLFTRNYAYRLTMANDRQPFVRWEYFKPQSDGQHKCRHHLQGPIELRMGTTTASLDAFICRQVG
jgi:hypothetical protein